MKPGWKKLMPGAYVAEDGTLHLDISEMLTANGYADTPKNRETMTQAAKELMREQYPEAEVIVEE